MAKGPGDDVENNPKLPPTGLDAYGGGCSGRGAVVNQRMQGNKGRKGIGQCNSMAQHGPTIATTTTLNHCNIVPPAVQN